MAQIQQSGPAQQGAKLGENSRDSLPRILRIGIVQSGKIVEERVIRKRVSVSIGQSAKNTFVVSGSDVLSRSFTMFEMVEGQYVLNFTESMDGRVAPETNVSPQTLVQLRQRAQKKNNLYQLPLGEKSRGKVVVGDVTVLFQFVTPPPIQPRPQLPPSVRGSLTQGLDWAMIIIAAVSMFGHVGFVFYLRQVDWPRKPDIEEIPDRFVQMIVPKKEEKPKVEKVDPNANKQAEAKDDGKKKKSGDEKKVAAKELTAEEKARKEAERKARLAAKVQDMGALKMLTARGEGGSILDTLKGGDPGGDADRVFGQVGGVGVAGAGAGGLHSAKGAGGAGSAKGIGGLRATGPGAVDTGDKGGEAVAKVKGSVKDSAPAEMDGALDPNVVANEIRRRKGAIIACYERALKRNPNLSGKVELQFTVSAIGKVTGADIGTDTLHDDEVGSCITSIVRTWRFPPPEGGGEVHFSYPFIFQASK